MNERISFLTHFFPKIAGLNYAAMGFTASSWDDCKDETLQLIIAKEDIRKVLSVIELSPYLRRVSYCENPFITTLRLTLSNGHHLNLHLISRFIRKGVCYMNETEVLNNTLQNSLGVKVAEPSYNFEYVWLIHCLNQQEVPDYQSRFFAKYDRETRSKIFAHIRGRYFLELNTLDELFPFHRKFYRKVREKILRRKENKWFKQLIRKPLYAIYTLRNMMRNHKRKVQFNPSGYAKALGADEPVRLL